MFFTLFQNESIILGTKREHITINIGEDEIIPKCPQGEKYYGTF
jgi:hypothetical protein